MVPVESDSVTTLPPSCMTFSDANCATFPDPDTVTCFPLKVSRRVFSISAVKYTRPYPVASGRSKLPPNEYDLPVSTPVNSLRIFLYWPNRYPISLAPTPISPAGTSVFGPMCLWSSDMNDWQKFITSLSLFPFGSKSEPPFPPPRGRVVRLFFNTCSNPRNLRIPKLTEGWKRRPPL